MEVFSEAGDLGAQSLRARLQGVLFKIMPNARFRVYLSNYREVLNQIWCGGCNPLEDIVS